MEFLMKRTTYFVLSAVSMICGVLLYPLFRGPDLLIWKVIPRPDFWETLKIPLDWSEGILLVLIGSGSDCLWLLSGIFLLRGLWFYKQKIQTIYIIIFYIIAAVYNAGQFFGIVPGVFCVIDLLTMSSVALAEGIIYHTFIKRRIAYEEIF